MNKKSAQTVKTSANQGDDVTGRKPIKIGSTTPFDFQARSLTAYGGLLPVATMLEKLGFQQLVEQIVTVKRTTRVMSAYQFILGMILSAYVGFSRLHHLRFLEQEPMLTGILRVVRLPPQSTFWRFLASLHLGVVQQLLEVNRQMRESVWEAAHVTLREVTLDTDTTVHTVFGKQMGGRKGYNPKNKGKKSFQPILTFIAETREYIGGELRKGDTPSGKEIGRHLKSVLEVVPPTVKIVYARVDSGFYCWEAVETYEAYGAQFIISARKTSRLIEKLKAANWAPSPHTDADDQCEFQYQPDGWGKAYRFLALRYKKDLNKKPKKKRKKTQEPEQYQLFDTPEYKYRVFVTNRTESIAVLVDFYNHRAGAENLIKEANNDAGLTAHASGRWMMNCNYFQLAMLAYNLNCWLMLFNREEAAKVAALQHTTLATARLRFLFLAAKIWRHSGRVGVSYSDHYAEQGILCRLMARLREVAFDGVRFLPVLETALSG